METFMPDIGDTVEFWNSQDELWETGDIVAYGADRRIYFIQPNDENLLECLVNYTSIRPLRQRDIASPETIALVARLRDERDEANQRAEKAEAGLIHYIPEDQGLAIAAWQQHAEKAEAELTTIRNVIGSTSGNTVELVRNLVSELGIRTHGEAQEIQGLRDRAEKAEAALADRRDRVANLKASRNEHRTRGDRYKVQAFEATQRADKLQAQIDAFPYETGAPVGDKVAARIAEYRERAEKEAARADRLAKMLDTTITERDAMTLRVEELNKFNPPKAVIDGQGDRWELDPASGLYEFAIFSRTLDNIEMNWGIEERIY